MTSLVQDLRYGLRTFVKNPTFTTIAVLTLALGIGSNTAVFSIVNSILLRNLAYPAADRLVGLYAANPQLMAANPTEGWDRSNISANDFFDWREQSRSFVDMGICRYTACNLTGGGRPERVIAARASAGLLPVLGYGAKIGRIFGLEEGQPGHEKVALLADGFWRRRFGGDPDVVGKTIMLDGMPFEVIGVLPAELSRAWGRFEVWSRFDVWTPFAFEPDRHDRADRSFKALARLKPGVSVGKAQAEMSAIASRLAEAYPESNEGYTVNVMPLRDSVVGEETKQALRVLTAAVGLVLLIACVNVANLLLAAGNNRSKELAIRAALGANRRRIVRQLITECTALSVAGAALGVLVALWSVDILVANLPAGTPRKHEIAVDGEALLFTLGLSLAAAFLFGLVPALKSSRVDLNEMLKEGPRAGTGGHAARLKHDFLIAVQVGVALGLLVSAGLAIKSFLHLRAIDPGFEAGRLLTMRTKLSGDEYHDPERRNAFISQVVSRLSEQPGVTSAAAVSTLPLDGFDVWDYATIEEYSERHPGKEVLVGRIAVTPRYFETMRIPQLSGRGFSELDSPGGHNVVVVNEALARRFWPDGGALGKRLKYGARDSDAPWLTIVGVVGDVKQRGLLRETRLETYRPYAQRPEWGMSFVVRTDVDPVAIAVGAQSAVWEVDPDRAVYRVRSMEAVVSDEVGPGRVFAGLLTAFAVVALVLAAVGLYGVMSCATAWRTHEIGIRIALGAGVSDVLRLVVRRAILLTLVGIVGGIGIAFLLGEVLESLLYSVSGTDPSAFVGGTIILLAVGFIASYIPARRATKVDPMVALRCE